MSQTGREDKTRMEQMIDRIKKHPIIVVLSCLVALVILIGDFTGALAAIPDNVTKFMSFLHPTTVAPIAIKLPPLGTIIYTQTASQKMIGVLAWSPNGERIADMTSDGTIQIWDATTGKHPISYKGKKLDMGDVEVLLAWSHDSKRVAFIGTDGTVQIWLADRNSIVDYFPLDLVGVKQPVHALAWSPDDNYIAIGDDNGNVGIFDLNYWQGSEQVERYPGIGTVLAWSPNSKKLAIGGYPNLFPSQMELWDVSSFPPKRIQTYPVGAAILGLAWSPNGKFIAVTTITAQTGIPQIWDVTRQTGLIQPFEGNIHAIWQAWACDSNRIAFGGDNHAVTIWDRAANKPIFRFTDIVGPGPSDWSPDGMLIATASEDGRILVWQASEKNLCGSG